ncbi:MAG: hypothetical protein OEW09_06020 [Anaerolineae bacterium]|nr:hypothetical protein [Anaerolineae bacterium]
MTVGQDTLLKSQISNLKSQYTHHIIALVGYLVLTLIMTFPLVTKFTTAIPGDGFDGWQNYWNLWWVKKALLDLGANPFFCDYVYYPTGASLYFHTLNIFNGLLTVPVQAVFGWTVAYNFVVVFSFVVGGYGTYLLVYQLGAGSSSRPSPRVSTELDEVSGQGSLQGRLAAFVAGLVFTFSPYHFAHLLGHMQLIALEWLPFYVLFIVKALDSVSGQRLKSSLRNNEKMRGWLAHSWPAAVFLVLTFLCEWGYYVMYLAIFTLLYTGHVTWKEHSSSRSLQGQVWEPVARAGLIWLLFIVLASPILVPMAVEAIKTTEYLTPAFEQSVSLSADLLAFFTPNEMHPLWGEWARAWSERFTTTISERMVFAGYIPLALGALALWKRRQRAGFWALSLLVFFILALGPVLHVGGQPASVLGTTIPLPYIVLYRLLPFVRLSRSISRFDVMIMLSLAVLVGLGIGWLGGWGARRLGGWVVRWLGGWGVGGVAGALICFEFLAVPYPMTEVAVPSFYQQVAQEPGDFVLMELPMNWDRPIHMFNQVYHNKKLIAAYFGKPNPLSVVEKTPVLQHFRYLGPDIIAQDISEIGTSVLASFNVRYVILDLYQMPGGREREVTLHLTDKVFGDTVPFYRDERLIVYRVEGPADPRPFLSLGQNWGRREMQAERPIRQIGQGAVVHVRAWGPDSVRLRIAAQSAVEQCQLDVYSGSQRLVSFELEAAPQEFVTPLLSLTEGDNVFHLYYNGECKVGPIISELDLVS